MFLLYNGFLLLFCFGDLAADLHQFMVDQSHTRSGTTAVISAWYGIEKDVFISITSKLQIEDVIGREFLIRIGENTIISRARLLPKRNHTVDKAKCLVYN